MNNDGEVSLEEVTGLYERHYDHAKADAADREKMKESYTKLWRMYMKSAESDESGVLTPSILFESVKLQKDDPEFKKAFLAVCQHSISPMDVNGDGFLQEDEYTKAIAAMGFQDPNIVRRVFEAADTNKDGKLSWEEYGNAAFENLTSEDENSPFTLMWGPLV